MPTTDQDARALAYLAGRLREETSGCREWDQVGTFTIVKAELVGKNLAYAVEAVLCHGTDPDAKTPGAIKRPFLPPKPSEKPGEHAHPPKGHERCRAHDAQYADSCPWCIRGVRAWDEDDAPITRFDDPRKTARAAIRAARVRPEIESEAAS